MTREGFVFKPQTKAFKTLGVPIFWTFRKEQVVRTIDGTILALILEPRESHYQLV